MTRDWEGREITGEEERDKVILVWEIDPHLTNSDYTTAWIRGWQDMLDHIGNNMVYFLERFSEDELKNDGVHLTIRLVRTTVGEYEDLFDGDHLV